MFPIPPPYSTSAPPYSTSPNIEQLHNLRQTPPDSIDPLDTRFNDPAIKYVRRKEDEMEEAEPINMAEEGFQRVCSARVRIPSEKKREEFWLSSKSGSMFREVKW